MLHDQDREKISKVLREITKSLDEEVKTLNKMDGKLVKRTRVPEGIIDSLLSYHFFLLILCALVYCYFSKLHNEH